MAFLSEYPLLPYPPVVVWDNKAYLVIDDTIQKDQTGERIGTVKRYIDPTKALPEFDGDSTIAPVGSEFFVINGKDIAAGFALFFDGGVSRSG